MKSEHLYVDVAERIEQLIDNEVLKVGDRLLSVRALGKEQGISLTTAFKAYYHLESKGLIEARPQSGYYVRFSPNNRFDIPTSAEPTDEAVPISLEDMISSVYSDLRSPNLLSFSLGAPHASLLPAARLNKSVMAALRHSSDHCLNYEHKQGNEQLRKQIARLAFNWGGTVDEDDIVVTAGCMEALSFCLKAVTQPGDAVATESPTFYGIFSVMQSLGLKVVEVPTDPVTGVDLNYLETAIPKFNIKACLFVGNFHNPLGSCIPDDKKRQLVDLVTSKDIPLIEDDIYGELYFGKKRPTTCKTYDKKGLVLHCSSFSKALAPGYRLGWAIPGRFKDKVLRLKGMSNVSTNTLSQEAIAHFLKNNRYELHLRHLRKALYTHSLRYLKTISESFPKETKITRPQGGLAMWVEMDKNADAYRLYKRALKQRIGIAPGQIFSSQGQFQNYFRISYGLPWDARVEEGLQRLGELITKL